MLPTRLEKLPALITASIASPELRKGERKRLAERIAERTAGLQSLAEVSIREVKEFSRLVVHAAGVPATLQETDSEAIAMKLVADRLVADGWKVADVHLDNRGYDLHAVRGG